MTAFDWRGIALSLAACVSAALAASLLRPIENQAYDARLSFRHDAGWPSDLVLVPIDDDAFFELGRWPWPRARIAELLREMTSLGAKTVVFDALLAAPTSAEEDAALEAVLSRTLIPIGYSPNGGPTGPEHSPALQSGVLFLPAPVDELRPELMVMPLERFSAASAGIGTTIFFPDPDGAVRRVAPLHGIRSSGASLPFLGLRALLRHREIPESGLRFDGRRLHLADGRALAVDARGEIPLDLVPGGKRPVSVRAADLLARRELETNRRRLDGSLAVVFVDSQTHPDHLETPLGPRTAGGLVLATAIRTFDLDHAPRTVRVAWVLLALGGVTALASSLLLRLPTERILLGAGVAFLMLAAVSLALVPLLDVFLPVAGPSVFLLVAGAGFAGLSAQRTRDQFENLKKLRSLAPREPEPRTVAITPPPDAIAPGEDATRPGVVPMALVTSPSGSDPAAKDVPLVLGQPVRIGRYEVMQSIGRGGMGTIFLARDPELKREVALKVLSESEPTSFERFRREAQAIARIEHPNVVRVFEVGFDARVPYFVMEYLPGGTLKSLLRENGERLPWERSVRVMLDVARGLGAAHALGIVHRDMKPSNVLLRDTQGTLAKVADFGVAKLSAVEALTQQGTIVGTLGFLAPELVLGTAATPRSDVFSLGVTWFRTLTGQLPFDDVSPAALIRMARTPVPDPRRIVPMPDAVATLLLSMTELGPEDRPADASIVARELEALLR